MQAAIESIPLRLTIQFLSFGKSGFAVWFWASPLGWLPIYSDASETIAMKELEDHEPLVFFSPPRFFRKLNPENGLLELDDLFDSLPVTDQPTESSISEHITAEKPTTLWSKPPCALQMCTCSEH